MNVDTVITSGHIIDPARNINEIGTVAIKNGKFVDLPTNDEPVYADETIDATGMHVIPGMIDSHAHFAPHGNLLAHCDAALSDNSYRHHLCR